VLASQISARCDIIRAMRSIMDYARAWRRRHGLPLKVGWEQPTLDEMPVGRSGYVNKVVVDAEGQPFAPPSTTVLRDRGFNAVPPDRGDDPAEPPAAYDYFVERVSDDEYGLTIERGQSFRASSDEAPTDAVRFRSLFAAPTLSHPRRRREQIDRLPLDDGDAAA
jgi:hypothetical protein